MNLFNQSIIIGKFNSAVHDLLLVEFEGSGVEEFDLGYGMDITEERVKV